MKFFTSTLLICLLFSTASASAQPGSLDKSFSRDGKVVTQIGDNAYAWAVAMLPSGKILAAGTSDAGSDLDFVLVRYTEHGNIDSTFGNNGMAITDFGKSDEATSIAVQANGKILVTGASYDANNPLILDLVLARYREDGRLDSSFGENGKVIKDQFFDVFGNPTVVVQENGKIVVTGTGEAGTNFSLARFRQDGEPDSSFGSNGEVITGFEYPEAFSCAIELDEKIIVTGYCHGSFAMIRYKRDGNPDSSFGTYGKVISDFVFNGVGRSIAIQTDGKIVLGGQAGYPHYLFALLRYGHDGKPDSSFGTNGLATTDVGYNTEGGKVAIQKDGKILMAGYTYTNFIHGDENDNFVLVRYKANGVLDSSFGKNGKVYTDFGSNERATSLAIQADKKIVVAGYQFLLRRNQGYKFAIARYNGDNDSAINTTDNISAIQPKQNSFGKQGSMYLFPNPVKDILQVQGLTHHAKTISIIDIKGKILRQTITPNSSYSFNVKQLPAGIYFIKVEEQQKETASMKFIKE